MIVEITDKGRNYLHDLREGTKEYQSIFDVRILEVVIKDGEHDIEEGLAEHEARGRAGLIEVKSLRASFRRLFEAGMLEEV